MKNLDFQGQAASYRKMKIKKELKGLSKSFNFAFRGIKNCIISERNMRIHIVISIFVLFFSSFYDFSKTDYVLLFLAISSVISCEMMNTAVESIVDLTSPSFNKLAQIAKDIAAGAVFVSAFFAAVIGFILFFDINKFIEIFSFFAENIPLLLLFAVCVVFSLIFIFKGIYTGNAGKFKNKKS